MAPPRCSEASPAASQESLTPQLFAANQNPFLTEGLRCCCNVSGARGTSRQTVCSYRKSGMMNDIALKFGPPHPPHFRLPEVVEALLRRGCGQVLRLPGEPPSLLAARIHLPREASALLQRATALGCASDDSLGKDPSCSPEIVDLCSLGLCRSVEHRFACLA